MCKALRLRERANALPCRRARIPEVRIIAELLHLRGTGRRIRRSKGLRHRRQVEVRVRKPRDDARDGRNRARAIWQECRAVVRVILGNEAAHALRNRDILVFIEQRPVGKALRDNDDDLFGLLNLRALSLSCQVDIEVIGIRRLVREFRGERPNVVRREVKAVAGQHTFIETVGAVAGLHIVEDGFVKEFILRDAGIFPVHRGLPAEAAAKDAEQYDDVRQIQEGQTAQPAHEARQAHAHKKIFEKFIVEERAQDAPEHICQQQSPREAHGQIILLHHRNQQGIEVIIGPRKQHLIEIGMELAVKWEARDVENRERHEQNGVEHEHTAPLPARPEVVQQKARHKAHERQRPCRLHGKARAAPDGRKHIVASCPCPHIRRHPEDKKHPENGKDCEVKYKYLQSFQDAHIQMLPGKPGRPRKPCGHGWHHGRMISTP